MDIARLTGTGAVQPRLHKSLACRPGKDHRSPNASLLELLVFDRDLRDVILPQLEPSDYENLSTAEIFAAFHRRSIGSSRTSTPETVLEHIGDDEMPLDLAHKLLTGKPRREKDDAMDNVLHEAENCVFALRNMAIANRIMEISREARHRRTVRATPNSSTSSPSNSSNSKKYVVNCSVGSSNCDILFGLDPDRPKRTISRLSIVIKYITNNDLHLIL